MSEYQIRDEGDIRKYYTQVPNIIDDTEMSVYAFRLYVHLKRVAGDDGTCWQSTSTLADSCNMSAGMIVKAKDELKDLNLIEITKEKNPRGGRDFHRIKILDIWIENINKYAASSPDEQPSSPHELASSQDEFTSSPHELKKNPIKNNIMKEENNNNGYSDLSIAFVNKTKIPELSGGVKRWCDSLNRMGKAGVTPRDIENAIDILWDRNYNIVGLASIENTAISVMSKRVGKQKTPKSYTEGELSEFINS